MRVKPTVITLDMPSATDDVDERCGGDAEPGDGDGGGMGDAGGDGVEEIGGGAGNRRKHVTVVNVENIIKKKKSNGYANSASSGTGISSGGPEPGKLKIPGTGERGR